MRNLLEISKPAANCSDVTAPPYVSNEFDDRDYSCPHSSNGSKRMPIASIPIQLPSSLSTIRDSLLWAPSTQENNRRSWRKKLKQMSFVTTSDFFEAPGQMKKNQTGIFDCIHHIPPDLAPSDYHLFRSLEHFESLQHMKKNESPLISESKTANIFSRRNLESDWKVGRCY